MARRPQPYAERAAAQRALLGLPLLPTTTIGSFPQTAELRTARADLRSGRIGTARHEERIEDEIREVIAFQEKAGLDVLVHGEPERNDMVQYFAEQLTGYLATRHGWVQSYGTRYVRPPVLAGDVSRPDPMTVRWTTYAQTQTARPVKGMLTGPVTMLAWSFVRDDQPLGDTARQVALALRDEVEDLEADVISLEAARSHMQVADELAGAGYPREVGPGVWDIHSPRVPSAEESAVLLRKGLEAIAAERLWVNPDCGLKTRGWPETRASLANLVAAAPEVRGGLPAS